MNQTALPCTGPDGFRWDLDHADHERIIGPCLSCSEAVTGCSVCPLREQCAADPCPGTIRGGIAWFEVPIRGRRQADECPVCGNPVLSRYQRKFCSVSCRKEYRWTYRDALAQEERFRWQRTPSTLSRAA